VTLALAGLIAGLATAGLDQPVALLCMKHPSLSWLILGGPFGAMAGVSLFTYRVLRGFKGFLNAILLVALSSCTFFISHHLAVYVELALKKPFDMGQFPSNSPISMFTGGFVGGLLLLGGAFLLVYPRSGFVTGMTTVKGLFASVFCGILGIAGWALGPYLGIHVWSLLDTLSLTPSTETFQNMLRSDISREYSLFVVWQTCTALLLGFILQTAQSQARLGSD